jgi:hypothetical protein
MIPINNSNDTRLPEDAHGKIQKVICMPQFKMNFEHFLTGGVRYVTDLEPSVPLHMRDEFRVDPYGVLEKIATKTHTIEEKMN